MTLTRRKFLKAAGAGFLASVAAGCGPNTSRRSLNADRPNILIFLSDALRADRLGTYGYAVPTSPHLDRFAEKGIVFERAYSPAPWTKPSIGSLFTGVPPRVHRATMNHGSDQSSLNEAHALRASFVTLAERLKGLEYDPAYFLSNGNVQRRFGFAQGFDHYFYAHRSPASFAPEFMNWFSNRGSKKPFFSFIHEINPHGPYFPEESNYRSLFGESTEEGLLALSRNDQDLLNTLEQFFIRRRKGERIPLPSQSNLSEQGNAHLQRLYSAEIHGVDQEFGKILRFLEQQNAMENTVVVFTADHGEGFGEHDTPFSDGLGNYIDLGGYFHGHSLHDELLHVPLVLGGGSIEGDIRVSHTVGLVDLYPTLLTLAGAKPPFHFNDVLELPVQGEALVNESGNVAVADDRFVYADIDYYSPNTEQWDASLILGRLKVLTRDGALSIFDRHADPQEKKNIYKGPGASDELDALVAELAARKKAYGALAERIGSPEWTTSDEKSRQELEALGYL